MNADEIAQLRALEQAATPGPWSHHEGDLEGGTTSDYVATLFANRDNDGTSQGRLFLTLAPNTIDPENGPQVVPALTGDGPAAEHNAALIAAMRNALPGLLDAAEEAERLRDWKQEYLAFTAAIGFGDNITEPAARPSQLVDPIEQAFSDGNEHRECPVVCEPCGERLASTVCPHCYGSGCGPGTASGAYSECEWCAGVGKIHEGCVERSYDDLATERDALRAELDALRGRVAGLADEWLQEADDLAPEDDWGDTVTSTIQGDTMRSLYGKLRNLLDGPA